MLLVWQSEFESPSTHTEVYEVLRRWLVRRMVAEIRILISSSNITPDRFGCAAPKRR